MSDYYEQLDAIKKAGYQHGVDHITNGATAPRPFLFSGEWVDGLTGQDAIRYAWALKPELFHNGAPRYDELDDYEQEDVLDYFEDGYHSAPWPQVAELWPEVADV